MTEVCIVGIAMTPMGKFPDLTVKDLARRAVGAALDDAGLGVAAIEAAWFANTRQPMLEGQNTIRGQCALQPLGFDRIPIVNVENACASGSTALLQAIAHIKAGLCTTALVCGAEKMFFPDRKDQMFRAFMGGTDIYDIDDAYARFAAMAPELIPEAFRDHDGGQRSFFMDSYAAFARLHMKTFGTTQRQFAAVAAKNHGHSQFNPMAQYRSPMTVDEVLADKLISWPFTRSMCAPISDGAAALVVCAREAVPATARARAARVRGIVLGSGSDRAPDDFAAHIGRRVAHAAYEQAGIAPGDIDVAEVHDATAYSEIQQIENLGLCEIGGAGPYVEAGDASLGGKTPVNPSGGLVSKGHPVGATGIAQLYELVTQLRGEAGERQVEDARIAVAENGGGFYRVEEAATVVTVLERGG